jgi:uncharacterized protein YgfB (UPF0149 family)
MTNAIDHNQVEAALRQCGSSWSAAQAHGLLCSRLAVLGENACTDWLRQILQGAMTFDALQQQDAESAALLGALCAETHRQLAGRQSEFEPLLPHESEPVAVAAAALAEWSEGFLHGLVSNVQSEELKRELVAEPLSDVIRDLLEMTRAEAGDDADGEANEQALTELVEYLRVAAQLVYEELAELRPPSLIGSLPTSTARH